MIDSIYTCIKLNCGDFNNEPHSNCPGGPESILIDKTEQAILKIRKTCGESNINLRDYKGDFVKFEFMDCDGNCWEPLARVARIGYSRLVQCECKSTVEDFLINKRGKEFIHWAVFNNTTIYNRDAAINELKLVCLTIRFSSKDVIKQVGKSDSIEDRGGFKFL